MGAALSTLQVPSSADTYSAALEGLVGVDEVILRRNRELPTVYGSGVKYATPEHRCWRYPNEIARDGWGDCEGLSAWRAAELRVTGADPGARVKVYKTSRNRYHAIVVRGDGWVEDPSIVCGMSQHPFQPWTERDVNRINRPWPREASIIVGGDDDTPGFPTPSFDVVKHADGYSSILRLPYANSDNALYAISSISPDGETAARKGVNLTRDLAAHLNDDPYTLAQLNPYSAQAVQTLARPDVQTALKAGQATAQQHGGGGGILAWPGNFLEQPGVSSVVSQLGPYGAIAAGLINNPAARGIRHLSHEVAQHIPLIGWLF